jgi:hypothetical protein
MPDRTPSPTPEAGQDERTHGWIWSFCDVVGNLDNYRWVYTWDGEAHSTRDAAIKAGLHGQGSDDFLVAQLDHGKVVWVGWQDKEHADAEDRDALAASLGFTS